MSLEVTHHVLGTVAAIAEMAHVRLSLGEHPPDVRRNILFAGSQARAAVTIAEAKRVSDFEVLDEAIDNIRDAIDREFDRIKDAIDPDKGMDEGSAQRTVQQVARNACVRLKMIRDLIGELPEEFQGKWDRLNCSRFR